MKFVILSNKAIPMFNGMRGPVMTPTEYDIHLVLRWISLGLDIREVMEDGSYRKLKHNDPKLMELLSKKLDENAKKRQERKEKIDNEVVKEIIPQGNIKIKEEKKIFKQPVPKKEEPKKQENKKNDVKKEEPKKDLFIDDLEKPE
jgi:hypothetical protein